MEGAIGLSTTTRRVHGEAQQLIELVQWASAEATALLADAAYEGGAVPELEVDGVGTFDVEEGKRLVLAIEEDAGVDIMHACGSYAKCTTCRVEFLEGEPEDMTEAEMMILDMRQLLEEARLLPDLPGPRHEGAAAFDRERHRGRQPGAKPQEEITPEPIWIERPY